MPPCLRGARAAGTSTGGVPRSRSWRPAAAVPAPQREQFAWEEGQRRLQSRPWERPAAPPRGPSGVLRGSLLWVRASVQERLGGAPRHTQYPKPQLSRQPAPEGHRTARCLPACAAGVPVWRGRRLWTATGCRGHPPKLGKCERAPR